MALCQPVATSVVVSPHVRVTLDPPCNFSATSPVTDGGSLSEKRDIYILVLLLIILKYINLESGHSDKNVGRQYRLFSAYLNPYKFRLPLIFASRGAKIGGSDI